MLSVHMYLLKYLLLKVICRCRDDDDDNDDDNDLFILGIIIPPVLLRLFSIINNNKSVVVVVARGVYPWDIKIFGSRRNVFLSIISSISFYL